MYNLNTFFAAVYWRTHLWFFHPARPPLPQVPIPSYLIALAVGALESRELGPRSRVWSEPSMVDAGAYEFAETEEFIKAGPRHPPPPLAHNLDGRFVTASTA
jgi:hypothetical protein